MNGRLELLRLQQRERQVRRWRGYLVAAVLLCLAALVCLSEPEAEVDTQLAYYCEMVDIHKEGLKTGDTGLGWPDFKAIYDMECR